MIDARFGHVNVVAHDWRRLVDFYERLFGCVLVPPERDYSGPDLEAGTGVAEAALRGASLNVMINLASVKDPAQVKALSEDLDRALDGAEAQRKRITDFVETRIAR